MKILHRYIYKELIGPFLFSLSIIMFLFLMQYLVKIINEIFGKGLALFTIFKLIVFNLAWMMALAVPMATLLAVLMAYGRFSADNEIIILKSSGISIYRMIRPALVFGAALTVFMLYFNDQILPDTNHAARQLFQSIRQKKPTLTLEEHIFFKFPPYSFVVDHIKKPLLNEWVDASNLLGPEYQTAKGVDRLEGITIFDNSSPKQTTTITANTGYMVYSKPRKALIFTLFDGEYHDLDIKKPDDYQRSHFEKQIVNIPAKNFELEEHESNFRSDREMNIKMMYANVIKSRLEIQSQKRKIKDEIQKQILTVDKLLKMAAVLPARADTSALASLTKLKTRPARQRALRQLQRNKQILKSKVNVITNKKRIVDKYMVEIYKKLSIPFACIVFVIIGAPLGIMSRKGNLGTAFSLSLGFFVVYWAFLIGGEKLADRNMVSPFMAMWSANFIILAVGLLLLYRSVKESSFIHWEKLAKLFKWKATNVESGT